MDSKSFRRKVFLWAFGCYAALSLLCLLPEALSDFGVNMRIAMGPPGLLGWGIPLLPAYLATSVVLAVLLYCGLRWPDDAGPFALALAIALWLTVGWFGVAMSI